MTTIPRQSEAAATDAPRHRIAIVVLGGTIALDLAVAMQAFGPRPSVFRNIRDEDDTPYEVILCGPQEQLPGAPFPMTGLRPYAEIATADTVLVPGVDSPNIADEHEALDAIAAAARRGARLVSLCAGSFVLGYAGVLAGHRVTTHWALADVFRAEFPDVTLAEQELYVDDGQVLTSGGMLAAADLCLHILRQDHGQSYANDVARLLVSPPHRSGGQGQYVKPAAEPSTGSLAPVLAWVLDNLDRPLTLEDVARQAHMSTRTLGRRFRRETGTSLMTWIAERRVERGRALLEESDLTVAQIAHGTGFGSIEAFRRQFAARTGTSPRGYRETFAVRSS